MNAEGIIIGLGAFLIIGVLHPVVIKTEYHLGVGAWPAFLILGLIAIGLSLIPMPTYLSALFGVLGFSFLWSIRELFEQRERVRKGWFPENPAKGDMRKREAE
ncbi:MAG: DUF4491 family protein [Christensenellales bacterium]|jgi:hypothetical protein